MRHFFDVIFTRHEPVRGLAEHGKSALGAVAGILLIAWLAQLTELPLLLAPLGATAVILFGYPGGTLAQPINIFGSYLIATIIGVTTALLAPSHWWLAAPAVGLALFLMQTLRVTHPPAGATPIVALLSPEDSATLFVTLLVGCVAMVALAMVWHYLPPRRRYPAEHPGVPVQEPAK